jgi:diguanylate cyclase (GGDEF)-like protein/PAS domain S-box-containing protein
LEIQTCLRELNHVYAAVTSDVVSTPDAFCEKLSSLSYDVVLAEFPVPVWEGRSMLDLLRQSGIQPPIIFVGDSIPQETAAELLSQGAADCIELQHVGHLPALLRRVMHASTLREERDQAEQRLRHSEAHYRALVGNLLYGMCRSNVDGRILDANQALAAMLGYASREELLGKMLPDEVLRDRDKRLRMLGLYCDGMQSGPLEVAWRQKDGTTLKVRLSGREAEDDQGQTDGYEIVVEDVTKQRETEDHLRQLAAKDPLTGLANYRTLVDVLDTEIRRSERTRREFALVLFDLDNLKRINDQHGHLVGNEALCRLADALSISCRDIDTAARFGGDEFALVLPETAAVSANLVARRICDGLASDGRGIMLTASIGIAVYPTNGRTIGALLGAADAAMYAMKDEQRNSVTKAFRKLWKSKQAGL